MPSVPYRLVDGSVKIQIEDVLGTRPGGGWVYQAPGVGNADAEGAHYYYRSQTAEGSHKTAPREGRFSFDIAVEEAGTYAILLRASRDTASPGDARNDIWIRVDGGTEKAMPDGTPPLTTSGGFAKFKSAPPAEKWVNANTFSTPAHGDANAPSDVVLGAGTHTITFAPRSTGYHIDSVQIVRKGGGTVDPEPRPEPEPEPEPQVAAAHIAAPGDDFESNKAAASKDLEFGRDGDGAQSVGLRFEGLEIDAGAEIESAYFVFTAAESGAGAARFTIEIEDTTAARSYSRANAPDDRDYLDETVAWTAGTWQKGGTYRSADVSELIERAIGDGGLDALDALAFRITGSGARAAEAREAGLAGAPELVIDYA
jgi:hypothetical protein